MTTAVETIRRRLFAVSSASVSSRTVVITATVVITSLGLVLRVWDLGEIGLNSDEAVYTGQAGALAGDAHLAQYFSPFRAHPLDLQTLIALLFTATGVSDVAARLLVAVLFGFGGMLAVGVMAARMYGRQIGILAMAVIAVLPYHVVLSRQITLDVPVMALDTLTMWCLYEFIRSGRGIWLLRSAPLLGLAVATKETAVLVMPAMILALVWCRRVRTVRPALVVAGAALAAVPVLPFVLSRVIFHGSGASGYVFYQFSRPPNHEWWYFGAVLLFFVGVPALLAAVWGLVVMARRRTDADRVLLSWLVVQGLFFQLWPTKLFPYLIVITPPLAVATSIGLVRFGGAVARRMRRPEGAAMATGVLATIMLVALTASSVGMVRTGIERTSGPFDMDVEVQDFAGGREVAEWIGQNTPKDSVFLTIGPSIGNIISFYGDRDWYALSVSQNPHLRNPAYRPVANPDLKIRSLQVQYAVWDFYSADRSAFYNGRLMKYVRRYRGVPVFSSWRRPNGSVGTGRIAPRGTDVRLVVYDLAGGDPLGERVS